MHVLLILRNCLLFGEHFIILYCFVVVFANNKGPLFHINFMALNGQCMPTCLSATIHPLIFVEYTTRSTYQCVSVCMCRFYPRLYPPPPPPPKPQQWCRASLRAATWDSVNDVNSHRPRHRRAQCG